MDQYKEIEQAFLEKVAEIILNKVDARDYGFRAVIMSDGHFNGRALLKETMCRQYTKSFFRLMLNLGEGLGPEEFMVMWMEVGEHICKTAYSKDLKSINDNHNKNKHKNNNNN